MAPLSATPSRVTITGIRLLKLRVLRELSDLEPAWEPGRSRPQRIGGELITEIQTDAGLTGIGPGFSPDLLPVVRALLIGTDPMDIEHHAAALRYDGLGLPYRGAACVDIALWDLIGKICNQPLYKLWGGGSGRVLAYASTVVLSTPEERADYAAKCQAEGWQAVKLRLHHATMAEDIRTVELVRQATGDNMVIGTDANQAQGTGTYQLGIRWDFQRALYTAKALDEMQCAWLEEPLPRFAFDDLARLNAAVAMPIAGGENNRNMIDFRLMVEKNVYDILQPEGMVMVGPTELRKVATLAQAYEKRVMPHHGGRGLGTIAHLHLVASWPHAPYLELLHDPEAADYRNGFAVMQDPPTLEPTGHIAAPSGPGLGVDLLPDIVDGVIDV